jgi:hypothetical protein
VVEFADWLDGFMWTGDVLSMVHTIWQLAGSFVPMLEGVADLGLAWCDDCASVL